MSSFLTNLVVPLNLSITMLLVAVLLFIVRQRKTAFALTAAALCWSLFWSLPATSLWAGGRLEQLYPRLPLSAVPTAPAIVVLGGQTANGRPNWFEPYNSTTATERIDTAAQLYAAHRAPLIIVSGAAYEGKTSEAQVMAQTLRQRGVPDSALILESAAANTYENGVYSAAILKRLKVDRALIVTSALHMPRSIAVFKKQGITAIAAPAPPQIVVPNDPQFSFWLPNTRTFFASRSIIKEYVGLLMYWVRGWT
jgi:uncharacterized SAM-binding protein YcdF (DUF218 family)